MPSSDGFAALDAIRRRIIEGAQAGMVAGMAHVAAQAEAGGAFQNVTGAERGATVGYVPGVNDAAFAEAVAVVNDRNPGYVEVTTVGSVGESEIVGVLTSPTSYAVHLETRFGGRDAALGPAMASGAAGVTQAVAEGIAGVLH